MKSLLKQLPFIFILANLYLPTYAQMSQAKIDRVLNPVKVGQYLADSAWLINPQGDTIHYQAFKGKWLLMSYWTRGCRPCIAELPVWNAYYAQMDTSQLAIISIAVDDEIKKWEKAIQKREIKMPKFYAGRVSSNPFFAMNFRVMKNEDGSKRITTLTPQYVLIDPQGKIIDKKMPKPSSPNFEKTLEKYIQAK